jgi:hypothetical protein
MELKIETYKRNILMSFLLVEDIANHYYLWFLIKSWFCGLLTVEINNPSVPKTDTQKTENFDKAISLDQVDSSTCSL